ncbi:MAG: hypothetical protein H0U27_02090 [Nitrosopumilus sp.]|jgi:hypothetical protein|nr:hypothetical protein [Nitrosopumilus sp.]
MKRRNFIKITGIGLAVAALPSISFSSSYLYKKTIVSIIKNNLPFLNLDEEGVHQFAEDYFNIINQKSCYDSQKIKLKTNLKYTLKVGNLEEDKEHFVTRFLLSSDFFKNGMNEALIVKYLYQFEPSTTCSNPFSHLYYPSAIS